MPHRQSAHPYAAVMICTRALTMIRPPANLGTAEGAPRVSPRFLGTPSLAQQTGINFSLQVVRVLDCCIYGSSVRSNGTLTWVLFARSFFNLPEERYLDSAQVEAFRCLLESGKDHSRLLSPRRNPSGVIVPAETNARCPCGSELR